MRPLLLLLPPPPVPLLAMLSIRLRLALHQLSAPNTATAVAACRGTPCLLL
jgi:hypothetical protein